MLPFYVTDLLFNPFPQSMLLMFFFPIAKAAKSIHFRVILQSLIIDVAVVVVVRQARHDASFLDTLYYHATRQRQ